MEMKVECKWNSNFECTIEKGGHRKFAKKIFLWTMEPPHCLTQKCKKLNQLPSSWTFVSEVTPYENHQ
jgi:hypothetical protein